MTDLVEEERKAIDNPERSKRLGKEQEEIARLEERLAALKEVPVEVIRRPRLVKWIKMFFNKKFHSKILRNCCGRV